MLYNRRYFYSPGGNSCFIMVRAQSTDQTDSVTTMSSSNTFNYTVTWVIYPILHLIYILFIYIE